MNKTKLNNLKAEFLSELGLLVRWHNKLKAIVQDFKEKQGDKGTCVLGQGIDIVTEDYDVVVHFSYGTWMQSNIDGAYLKELINEIQSWCDCQMINGIKLNVIHEQGVMD